MAAKEKTGERVRKSSSEKANRKADQEIIHNIKLHKREGKEAIDYRIRQLDLEWDIERTLELHAGILGITGTLLGAFVNKRWLVLPGVVMGFLIQHSIQGWCPPLPLFRKLGLRTRPEIDREKYALKALRKDFRDVKNTREAWEAVNR